MTLYLGERGKEVDGKGGGEVSRVDLGKSVKLECGTKTEGTGTEGAGKALEGS